MISAFKNPVNVGYRRRLIQIQRYDSFREHDFHIRAISVHTVLKRRFFAAYEILQEIGGGMQMSCYVKFCHIFRHDAIIIHYEICMVN